MIVAAKQINKKVWVYNEWAKTLLKISVFARLLIVHLRIGAAAIASPPSVRPFEPKIKPAEPVEFLVGVCGQNASCY